MDIIFFKKLILKTPGVLSGGFVELDTFYLTVDRRTIESLRLEGGCLDQRAAQSKVNGEFRAGGSGLSPIRSWKWLGADIPQLSLCSLLQLLIILLVKTVSLYLVRTSPLYHY